MQLIAAVNFGVESRDFSAPHVLSDLIALTQDRPSWHNFGQPNHADFMLINNDFTTLLDIAISMLPRASLFFTLGSVVYQGTPFPVPEGDSMNPLRLASAFFGRSTIQVSSLDIPPQVTGGEIRLPFTCGWTNSRY